MTRLHQERGSALIVALWVLTALIILAAGLSLTARTEVRIARNYTERIRCRWAARAAVEATLLKLKEPEGLSVSVMEEGAGGLTLTSEDLGLDMGEAEFSIVIEDESGRVNVNTAPAEMLEALFGDSEASDCIIDWRDADDTLQPSGAETDYYSGLETPYRARNASLLTVGELRLIKGMTDRLAFSAGSTDGLLPVDLFTVYSHDRNMNAAGTKRINILTADKEALTTALGDVLDEKKIDALVKFATDEKPAQVAEIIDVTELSREDIKSIYDLLTVSDEEDIKGLININTASSAVLAAVPGLDEETAEEITTYRDENGPFADVGGILDISGLSEDAFRTAAPLLTARSAVYRLTASGFMHSGGGPFAITCVADMTGGTLKILYWQE
ncbi:MAG: type II secretion system protein GspK [bacterium]|nr:type II secretion system protein GspK [bacterium]